MAQREPINRSPDSERTERGAQGPASVADEGGGERDPHGYGETRRLSEPQQAIIMAYLANGRFRRRMDWLAETAKYRGEGRDPKPVAVSTFYRALRDPWFQGQLRSAAADLIDGAAVAEIVAARIECAKQPTREGHADAKLILEMAGLYRPAEPHGATLPGEQTHLHVVEIGERLERALAESQRRRAELVRTDRVADSVDPDPPDWLGLSRLPRANGNISEDED